MNENEYLNKVLKSQNLDPKGKELQELQGHRQDIEELLCEKFPDASLTIKYGGSKAKNTMNLESYDLDIVCYIPNDNDTVGKTLSEIFDSAYSVLSKDYYVERKSSALRLRDKTIDNYGADFHIDVVPGRYVDDTKTDVFLFQSSGEKERLKTNLELHIAHVKNSGVVDTIRLIKLWKVRNSISIKNFVLELLVIDILKNHKGKSLANQLRLVWEEYRDCYEQLSVEDPANPTGNDLSEDLNFSVRWNLHSFAEQTLKLLNDDNWQSVFPLPEDDEKENVSPRIVAVPTVIKSSPASPWSSD